VITLYDADRCPYCARVRIVLAEKNVEHETVAIDLGNRPAWIYELNPTGKVPVVEEDAFVLPESAVIMEYLEERYPEPALLAADPAARALERWHVFRFDGALGDDYYAFRRGDENALEQRLEELDVASFGLFASIAYVPWILRARDMLGVALPGRVAEWLDRLSERESVRAELEVVSSFARGA
jgi:glutathione S-transferase